MNTYRISEREESTCDFIQVFNSRSGGQLLFHPKRIAGSLLNRCAEALTAACIIGSTACLILWRIYK